MSKKPELEKYKINRKTSAYKYKFGVAEFGIRKANSYKRYKRQIVLDSFKKLGRQNTHDYCSS